MLRFALNDTWRNFYSVKPICVKTSAEKFDDKNFLFAQCFISHFTPQGFASKGSRFGDSPERTRSFLTGILASTSSSQKVTMQGFSMLALFWNRLGSFTCQMPVPPSEFSFYQSGATVRSLGFLKSSVRGRRCNEIQKQLPWDSGGGLQTSTK